jgi:hypothetical protein
MAHDTEELPRRTAGIDDGSELTPDKPAVRELIAFLAEHHTVLKGGRTYEPAAIERAPWIAPARSE